MADLTDRDRSTPGLDSTSLLADIDVGLLKRPTPPLAFSPRLNRLALAAAVGLQLFLLVAMIFGSTVPYLGAQKVLLQVEPIDPRDPFRGDYVTLGYRFSRIPTSQFPSGSNVYVALLPEPGRPDHYRSGEFLHTQPASGPFLRGVAQSNNRATFGIESFYVQEGTGHDYETAARTLHLWAEVAIGPQGVPALQRLVVE